MQKLLLLVAAVVTWASIASAQSVTLSNIPAVDSHGTVVQGGSLQVTWGPFPGNDGVLVPGGGKSAVIQNGVFNITLVASDNAGWPYNALIMGGAEPTVYLWKIPAAGGVTSIGQISKPNTTTTSTVTLSGVSNTVASVIGTPVSGNCAGTWDSHGNLTPANAPCSSTGGAGAGTAGQFGYYAATGTTLSGHTLAASDIPALAYDPSGAAAAAQAASLQVSANLADVANRATAFANLGGGTAGRQSLVTSVGTPGADTNVPSEKAVRSAIAAAISGLGTGSVGSATAGQFAYYSANGAAVGGHTLVAADIPQLAYASLSGLPSLGSAAAQNTTSFDPTGAASTVQAASLQKSANLSDLASIPAALANLGLAASATTDTTNANNITSGTLADGRLPSDQCVFTKYTVNFNDAALAVASSSPKKTLLTLPPTSVRICGLEISGVTSFTGIPNLTAATVRLQSSAATPLLYSPNQDIFGAVGAATNNYWTDAGSTADRTALGVAAAFAFTCSSGSCFGSSLTAGSVNITVDVRTMP